MLQCMVQVQTALHLLLITVIERVATLHISRRLLPNDTRTHLWCKLLKLSSHSTCSVELWEMACSETATVCLCAAICPMVRTMLSAADMSAGESEADDQERESDFNDRDNISSTDSDDLPVAYISASPCVPRTQSAPSPLTISRALDASSVNRAEQHSDGHCYPPSCQTRQHMWVRPAGAEDCRSDGLQVPAPAWAPLSFAK